MTKPEDQPGAEPHGIPWGIMVSQGTHGAHEARGSRGAPGARGGV